MKKLRLSRKQLLISFTLFVSLFIFSGCSGSEAIVGVWNAQNIDGSNYQLEITEDKITIEGESAEYKQIGTGFRNSVKYYAIEVPDGVYSIIFPDKDKDIAVLIDPESSDNYYKGTMIFAMSKTETPDYQETFDEYMSN